jgi:type II secretory pathway predicted ATPase ExeA
VAFKGDFVLEWDRALGFKSDPFADKIFAPIKQFLVDRVEEKEKLNWFFIKGYFYGTILGEQGVGKTMLLRWLEDRLKKYNRIHAVYINAAVFKEQVNIPQQMLMPLLSMYERMVSKPHKNTLTVEPISLIKKKLGSKSIALLIDNAQHLTEKNLEMLKQLRNEGLRFQIIVTSTPAEYKKSRLAELGQDDLAITLRRLNFVEAREMIAKRVQGFGGSGISPFNDEILQELYERSDKNPREFLHLCRDEAIRILIHKKSVSDRQAMQPMPPQQHQPAATAPAKASRGGPKVQLKKVKPAAEEGFDLGLKKATPEGITEPQQEQKRRFFRIRFDMGEKKPEPPRHPGIQPGTGAQPRTSAGLRETGSRNDNQQMLFNDKRRQELVDQLNSTSPRRRKEQEDRDRRKKEGLSETDKILRELADEFEKH